MSTLFAQFNTEFNNNDAFAEAAVVAVGDLADTERLAIGGGELVTFW